LIVDYIFDWARDVYRPSILRKLKFLAIGEAYDHISQVSDSDIFSLVDELDFDEQSTVPISGLGNHFKLKPCSWEQDVLLLAHLDFYLGNRDMFEKDRKKGISEILSAAMGNGYTPAQVERRLRRLWQDSGPNKAPQGPDPLNLFGASTRTT
jgi:hypothetical protein